MNTRYANPVGTAANPLTRDHVSQGATRGDLCTEASDLGWPPGKRLAIIESRLLNGVSFVYRSTDAKGTMTYVAEDCRLTLTVFND